MDPEEKFFENRVDRTPYSAFGWIASVVFLLLFGGGYSVWKFGSVLKARDWLSANNVPGATDALVNNASNALDSGNNSLDQAAKQAADAAQAQATQQLLDQQNAAIKGVENSASQQAQSAGQSAAAQGQQDFQKYLNTP